MTRKLKPQPRLAQWGMTSDDMFNHIARIQVRIMAKDSQLTREQFLSEPIEEQREYYRWIVAQAGELADLM